ncbi:hypothetical protein BC832DRAFT_79469 [Gaertneriomyces semiglobifer]|nr:hypothetical protein BC832DRAFT_79469 [Gaertneriomyces semiglobifer]
MSQTSAIDGPSAPASQSISEHHGPPAANGPPVDIMALLQRAKSVGQMETPYQSPPSQPNPVQQPSYAGPAPPLPQQPRDSSPYMYLPSARQATPTFPDHRQPVYQPAHPEPGPQSVISGEPLLAALGIRPQKPVSATFSTNQRQIQRLQDVWQWMEDLAPSQRGQLPDTEFRNRLLHLVQEVCIYVSRFSFRRAFFDTRIRLYRIPCS